MKIEHLSWSKEDRLEKCGQQFAYVYGMGLRRPPGVAQIRGRASHRTAEADLGAKLKTGSLLEAEQIAALATDYVDQQFKGEVALDGEYLGARPADARVSARDDARRVSLWHHENLAPTLKPVGLELRVLAHFPASLPVPYLGVIDVVEASSVRDLKTKRAAPAAELADESEQLTIYHALFEALYKRPPAELALDVVWTTPKQKFTNGKTLTTSRTEEDVRKRFARSRQNLAAMEAEIFLPAPVDSWVCSERWCGFTDICPYFRGRRRPTT